MGPLPDAGHRPTQALGHSVSEKFSWPGEGEISLEEFEAGTMRIKGMARSFDLAQVHRLVERLSLRIDEIARQACKAVLLVVFCCEHEDHQ